MDATQKRSKLECRAGCFPPQNLHGQHPCFPTQRLQHTCGSQRVNIFQRNIVHFCHQIISGKLWRWVCPQMKGPLNVIPIQMLPRPPRVIGYPKQNLVFRTIFVNILQPTNFETKTEAAYCVTQRATQDRWRIAQLRFTHSLKTIWSYCEIA